MSWVTIDKKRCDNCGTCRIRCPSCFIETPEGTVLPRGDDRRCIQCGHCVALCPSLAIAHERMNMTDFHPLPDTLSVTTDTYFDLLKRRRSHRHFLQRPIPRDHLEKLTEMCRFAPTGVNTQAVEIKIISNPERITEISRAAGMHFVHRIQALDAEKERLEAERRPIPEELATDIKRHARYRNIGRVLDKGFDPIFFGAPCLMLFHTPPRSRTPRDDCVIAAHTITLGAMTLGLESCYIGLFTRAAAENAKVLRTAQLPKENQLQTTLILGYPKLHFLRTVARRPIVTTWE